MATKKKAKTAPKSSEKIPKTLRCAKLSKRAGYEYGVQHLESGVWVDKLVGLDEKYIKDRMKKFPNAYIAKVVDLT